MKLFVNNKMSRVISLILSLAMLLPMFSTVQGSTTQANVPSANIKPGQNVLTGDNKAITFEGLSQVPSVIGYDFVNPANYETSIYTDSTGNSLRIKNNGPANYEGLYCAFETPIERKVAVFYKVKGCFTVIWTLSGDVVPSLWTLPGTQDWKSIVRTTDSLTADPMIDYDQLGFDGTYTAMSGFKLDALINNNAEWFVDDIAVVPFYMATYHISTPADSTETTETVEFLADRTAMSVAADGTINGIPTTYTPDKTLTCEGYEFLGWTDEKGGTVAKASIALSNADIELYPVWEKIISLNTPGLNALTKNNKVVDYNQYTLEFAVGSNIIGSDYTQTEDGRGNYYLATTKAVNNWSFLETQQFEEISRPVTFFFDIKTGTLANKYWNVSANSVPYAEVYQLNLVAPAGYSNNSWARYSLNSNENQQVDRIAFTNYWPEGEYVALDNLALIPHYRITYNTVAPGSSEVTATEVKYWLADDTTAISCDANGNITGLPTSYTPDKTLTFEGYEFLGWTDEIGGTVAKVSIDLTNADIELYPVWDTGSGEVDDGITPGMNIFTGTANFIRPTIAQGSAFAPYNTSNGSDTNSYEGFSFSSSDTYSGLTSTFTTPLPRKSAAIVCSFGSTSTYVKQKNNGVEGSFNEAFKNDPKVLSGWAQGAVALDAGLEQVWYTTYNSSASRLAGIAIVPYYKATYHMQDPTGAKFASSKVVQFLVDDVAALGSELFYGQDGLIMGLPSTYSPDKSQMTDSFDGYRFKGWSTQKNASDRTVNVSVPLANKDLDLYPVWVSTSGSEGGDDGSVDDTPYTEYNWGFEDGTISPFTFESGSLENYIGMRDTSFEGSPINKTGTYYFTTYQDTRFQGDEQTATLVSPKFVLGSLSITLDAIGYGRETAYIAVYNEQDEEIAKISPNTGTYVFAPYTIDLAEKANIGDVVYIKIVDNSTIAAGMLAVDNIKFMAKEPTTGGGIGDDTGSVGDVVDIVFDFETGKVEPFYISSGSVESEGVVVGQRYADNISPYHNINKQGKYYFTSYEQIDPTSGEYSYSHEMTAILKSRFFTVDVTKTPEVTFKLGGNSNANDIYVALYKADGTLVKKTTPSTNKNIMIDVMWDLTGLVNSQDVLYLEVVDKSASGSILFDDFRARGTLPNSYREYRWSFEDGTMSPFTYESGVLSKPISNGSTELNEPYAPINKHGTYYLTTIETADGGYSDQQTATLVSPDFLIGGETITVKMAGGSGDNLYVALYNINNQEIARVKCDENKYVFKDYTMNLAGKVSIGDKVYLKIVDGSTAGYGCLAVDDIRFTGLIPGDEVIDINFNFESGALDPFYVVRGDIQQEGIIIGNRVTEISPPNESINKEGEYYFTTVETKGSTESQFKISDAMTAVVRSPLFKIDVNNSPIVTFKMGGGAYPDEVYVALCKADGTVIKKASPTVSRCMLVDTSWDLTGLVSDQELVYIEIADLRTAGFGFIIFDDFKARGVLPSGTIIRTEEQLTSITGWSQEKFDNLKKSVEVLIEDYPLDYPEGPGFIAEIIERNNLHNSFLEKATQTTDSRVKDFASGMEALVTRIAFANPLIADAKMMIVARDQYGQDHHNTHNMFPSVPGEYNMSGYSGGGAVRVVDFANNGEVTTLLSSSSGVYRDIDLSYDANKFLVSYRKNYNDSYHIYEYTLGNDKKSASNEKQLTSMYGADDMDPMYMPSGNIVFSSTRDPKYVQCNRHISANIYRMESDGANIIQITNNTLFDRPTDVLPDGRILYDRWEYVDRDFGSAQGLWTVWEDGTQQATFYGNNTPTGSTIDAKVIPGTDKVAAILSSTHDVAWGAFAVIDRSQGVDGKNPVEFTYPSFSKSKILEPGGANSIDAYVDLEIKYEDPQPLDENFFLVSRKISAGSRKMGIYLIDRFGHETLLYKEDGTDYGAYDAVLIMPREKELTTYERRNYTDEAGEFVVQNVYEGTTMEGVEKGSVKTLRIVEVMSKYNYTRDTQWNGEGQQNPGVNWHSFEVKRVIGEVPVYEDGSAYFKVPENTFVYFQLLDEDGKMIQSMRSGTLVQSGEKFSCIGCHENRATAVPSFTEAKTLDALKENFEIIPNPDYTEGSNLPKTIGVNTPDIPKKRTINFTTKTDTLTEIDLGETDSLPTMNYLTEVQPIFTQSCISCHGYENPAADLTLVPDKGIIFNASYVDLWRNRGTSARFGNYLGVIGGGNTELAIAKSWGSYASPLIDKIYNDPTHKDLLTDAEKRRVAEWVDLNATYYGDYASNYPLGAGGRGPLTSEELETIPGLSWSLSWTNRTAMPIYFDNPEKSPILKNLSGTDYTNALALIQTGKQRLISKPDVDWKGLTHVPGDPQTAIAAYSLSSLDAWRYNKVALREAIEKANREAIANGEKRYDTDNIQANGYPDWPTGAFPGFNN